MLLSTTGCESLKGRAQGRTNRLIGSDRGHLSSCVWKLIASSLPPRCVCTKWISRAKLRSLRPFTVRSRNQSPSLFWVAAAGSPSKDDVEFAIRLKRERDVLVGQLVVGRGADLHRGRSIARKFNVVCNCKVPGFSSCRQKSSCDAFEVVNARETSRSICGNQSFDFSPTVGVHVARHH